MASYSGYYEIKFDKKSLSAEDRKQFENYLKSWEKRRRINLDWIEDFDYDSYSSILWDMNTPETIKDLHEFLVEAGTQFKNLEARGDGSCSDIMTGEWRTEYSFKLENGSLEWNENEESYGEEDDEDDEMEDYEEY